MAKLRPKITLHIYTSLDGRITGNFSTALLDHSATKFFQTIGFQKTNPHSFNFQGWIYGSNTSKSYFAPGQFIADHNTSSIVAAGDYLINQHQSCYYIALDRHGCLNWSQNTTAYAGQTAFVIEVLTNQASNSYKTFLRQQQIPYIIAGEQEIDLALVLQKLATEYNLDNLMLGGGGLLNWSFLTAGLIDEISLVVAPAIDGQEHTARLFNSQFNHDPQPIGFKLRSAQVIADNVLWLRYIPLNVSQRT